jgi:hypothetical protein
MPFYQNVFVADFEGNWVLGDRQHSPKFVVRRNAGRGDEWVVAWNEGPYDLSGNDADGTNSCDTLEIMYALREPKNWAMISVDITSGAASSSAVTPQEIVAALNSDTLFYERFEASLDRYDGSGKNLVRIRQKKPGTEMSFYIKNGRAEEKLRFNARAGVEEMPTYFGRHTIDNRFDYDDSQNHVIELDITGSTVDLNIVLDAVDDHGRAMEFGWDGTTERADWELLEGRSGLFDFTNVDGTSSKIIYSAGAKAGDLAKKIIYDSGNTFVVPYTLEDADLITPP